MGSVDPNITLIRWNDLSRKGWDRLMKDVSYLPYQQAYAFGEVVERHGGEVLRAEIVAEGETIGLCQFVVRRLPGFRLVTAIMGPLWLKDDLPVERRAEALDRLGRTLPLKGLHAALIMPPYADDAAERRLGLRQVVSPYHTVLLNLTKPEDDLLGAAESTWRNRLRQAQDAKLTVNPLGRRVEQYQWLLEAERRQRQRLGYRALSPLMVPSWQEEGGKDSVTGLEAKDGATRVAGLMIFRQGTTATYHISWSSEEGRERNAMNLLLWQAIRELKKKGVRTFDLGGVDTDHTPGVARFKLITGGEVLSQSGTWLLRPRLK